MNDYLKFAIGVFVDLLCILVLIANAYKWGDEGSAISAFFVGTLGMIVFVNLVIRR